jgi:hypothetical protein
MRVVRGIIELKSRKYEGMGWDGMEERMSVMILTRDLCGGNDVMTTFCCVLFTRNDLAIIET